MRRAKPRARSRTRIGVEALERRTLLAVGRDEITALYQGGFNPTALQLNGSARLAGDSLQLTDGGPNETASAYYTDPVDVSHSFTTTFLFRLTPDGDGDPLGAGFTFELQNDGSVTECGTSPDTLGLTWSPHVAVRFSTFNANWIGAANGEFSDNSAELFLGNSVPSVWDGTEIAIPKTVIDLHSQHLFQAALEYTAPQGGVPGSLTVTVTDTDTSLSWSHTYPNVDIQGVFQTGSYPGRYAYAGFTASTGSVTNTGAVGGWEKGQATQDILDWTWQDGSPQPQLADQAQFTVAAAATTSAAVYDADGDVVRTLWQLTPLQPGTYTAYWDGLDQYGDAINPATNPGPYQFRVVEDAATTMRGVIANSTADPAQGLASISAIATEGVAVSPDGSTIWTVGVGADTAGGGSIKEFDGAGDVNVTDTGWLFNYEFGYAVALDGQYLYMLADVNNWGGDNGVVKVYLPRLDQTTGFTDAGHVNPDGSAVVRNSSGDYLHVVDSSDPLFALRGIAVTDVPGTQDGTIWVTDPLDNLVRRYDKVTGDQVGSPIPLPDPTGIAVDAAGDVWVAHAAPGTTGPADRISVYSPAGALLATVTGLAGVRDVYSMTIANGKLYIADGGAEQVVIFTLGGTAVTDPGAPQLVGGPAGYGHDDGVHTFWALRGVAADSAGDIYTVQDLVGPGGATGYELGQLGTSFAGSQLEKWSPGGVSLWVKGGYEYQSVAGAYSPADPTTVYSSSLKRYTVDPSTGAWQYAGTALYPGWDTNPWSGVTSAAPQAPPQFVSIGSTEFLVLASGNRLIFYRVEPDGSLHPAAVLGTSSIGNSELWTWDDTLGDGVPQASQVQGSGIVANIWQLRVDPHGNVWYQDLTNDTSSIRELPLQGVDARGDPVYDWGKAVTVAPVPAVMTMAVGDDGIYAEYVDPDLTPPSSVGCANALCKFSLGGALLWTIALPEASESMDAVPGGGVVVGGVVGSRIYLVSAAGLITHEANPLSYGDWLDFRGGSLLAERNPDDGEIDVFTEGVGYSDTPWYRVDDGTPDPTLQGVVVPGGGVTLLPPPAAPSSPALVAADDTGTPGDGVTSVRQPRLTGTATPGSAVQLLSTTGVVFGSAVAGAGGGYLIRVSSPLANGTYVLEARSVSASGVLSPVSGTSRLTIMTTPPAAPSAPTLLPSDDSGVKGDNITDVTQPHLVGTAPAGTTVQLVNASGAVIGSAAVSGTSYSVTPTVPLASGTYLLDVRAVDVAGNVSAPGGTLALTIATTLPPAPSPPTLLASDDTGTVGDAITSVTQPHLIGTAPEGTTVQLVTSSGRVIGSVRVVRGSYSVMPTTPLTTGTYVLDVQAVDVAGNVSAPGGTFTLTILATPPAALSAPTLLLSDDTGVVGDGVTSVRQPHLVGTVSSGVTVEILGTGGAVLGRAPVAADGSYSVQFASPLSDGTYSVSVEAIDASGSISAPSPALSLTIMGNMPPTPAAPVLDPLDDSGVKGDGITNVKQPQLIGTVDPNSTVQLLDKFGYVVTTATADATGAYTITVPAPLFDGPAPFQVREMDLAGDLSDLSPPSNLVIHATPPAAPSAPTLLPSDDSGVKGDNITDVTQPHLVGTAPAGTTVQLVNASGAVIGSAAVSGTSYSVTPTVPLASGTYLLDVRAVDVAGNVSAPGGTLALTILATPPAAPSAPTLLPSDDSGVKGDNITDVTQPHLVGTAPAGTTVQLVNASGAVIGSAPVSAGGSYSVAPSAALTDGGYAFSTQAVDVAGNVSAVSGVLNLTIRTTPPPTPTAPTLLPSDDSGTPGDGITNVTVPRLTGTAVAGDYVVLRTTVGTILGVTIAAGSGSYTVQVMSPLADGAYSLETLAIDVAGNVSPASGVFTLTILTKSPPAPAPPTLSPAEQIGAAGSDSTSVRSPLLLGTAAPGAIVQLLDPSGNVIGTTVASSPGGSYSIQPAFNLGTATFPLTVRVVDVAGNLSPPSAALPVRIVDATTGDFTGAGTTELTVFRPSTSQWISQPSQGGPTTVTSFGAPNLADIPVPGDYLGLGYDQIAVFRQSTAQWFVLGPGGARLLGTFGAPNLGDIPVPGDYDGVGHTEMAVFRPSTGQWFVLGPTGVRLLATWGAPNGWDIPVPGDYDGTGRTEVAIFRPSTGQWFVIGPHGPYVLGIWGAPSLLDIPIPGDYYNVGHDEMAVFRPSTGQWFVAVPNGGRLLATYGWNNLVDLPAPAASGMIAWYEAHGRLSIAAPTSNLNRDFWNPGQTTASPVVIPAGSYVATPVVSTTSRLSTSAALSASSGQTRAASSVTDQTLATALEAAMTARRAVRPPQRICSKIT